jgi:hypothetical protein
MTLPPRIIKHHGKDHWLFANGRIMPVIQGGALPTTDAFTGSTDTQLTTYSASWTLNSGNYDIQTNAVSPDDGGARVTTAAHWNADSFSNDQYSQLTLVAVTSAKWNYLGVSVRCAASSTNTFYNYIAEGSELLLMKVVAGTETQLGKTITTVSANDVLRLEVSSTTLTPKRNGVTDAMGAQTDSGIASGYAGIGAWQYETGSRTQLRGDNWEGGNLGGAPAAPISTKIIVGNQSIVRSTVW